MGQMWEHALEWTLWYFSFVHPLILGTRLCRRASKGKPVCARSVTNVTLAMIILWMFEVADSLVLVHLISAQNFYRCVRLVLTLYLLHPKFNGATSTYNRHLARRINKYAPYVDEFVTRHMRELSRSGVPRYLGAVALKMITAVTDVIDIAWQLLVATTDTNLPPAELERRLTPERADAPTTPCRSESEFTAKESVYTAVSPKETWSRATPAQPLVFDDIVADLDGTRSDALFQTCRELSPEAPQTVVKRRKDHSPKWN